MIPETEFASLYHQDLGRPNFPVAILVGLSIMKEMLDLSDDELMDAFYFDLRFHYAFGLCLEETGLVIRTVRYFRSRVFESHSIGRTFDHVASTIIETLDLKTDDQRMDSSHIRSNMATLTRLGLFTKTIEKFVARLKKAHPDRFEALPKVIKERYGERPGHFANTKSSKGRRRLETAVKDLWSLVERFRQDADVNRMHGYKLLLRLLEEQCIVTPESGGDPLTLKSDEEVASQTASEAADPKPTVPATDPGVEPVALKEGKDVASDTLQNPSDPDATYDGHKGQGYQVQFAETCAKENAIQVITYVEAEPAHKSDQDATIRVIDALDESGHLPGRLFADTSYNSGENLLEAAIRGVELMAPTPGQFDPNGVGLMDFGLDIRELKVLSCPCGLKPIQDTIGKDGKTHNLLFDLEQCRACQDAEGCPVAANGRYRYRPADVATAYSRAREETEAFQEAYKIRAGIESTNAEGKTAHGLGKVWGRRLPKVSFAAVMKAMAMNVKRFMRYQCAQILEKRKNTAMAGC
ncbi:MAG: transposase [Magnetococcales bacterium]|nr:transposase [Magnetococcales bacterium]